MGWIKDKIRKWLAEDEGPPEPVMEAVVDNQITRVIPMGAVGAGLLCKIPSKCGGMQSRIVLEDSAIDKRHFWHTWEHMGGQAVWDDGTPFVPN